MDFDEILFCDGDGVESADRSMEPAAAVLDPAAVPFASID
jgi:hypothetical protein